MSTCWSIRIREFWSNSHIVMSISNKDLITRRRIEPRTTYNTVRIHSAPWECTNCHIYRFQISEYARIIYSVDSTTLLYNRFLFRARLYKIFLWSLMLAFPRQKTAISCSSFIEALFETRFILVPLTKTVSICMTMCVHWIFIVTKIVRFIRPIDFIIHIIRRFVSSRNNFRKSWKHVL